MKNSELESLINEKLNSASFSDYGPNGLQVEGRETVQKIITGVTASQALLPKPSVRKRMPLLSITVISGKTKHRSFAV